MFKKINALFKANYVYLEYIRKNGKIMVFTQIIYLLLGIPINLLYLYVPKLFLDSINNERSIQKAIMWILLLIISTFIYELLKIIFNKQKLIVMSTAKLSAKIHALNHYQSLYLSYFENNEKMNIANRAMSYAEKGGDALFNQIIQSVNILISLATVSYVSFTFDWWIWILIFLIFLIKMFVGNFGKKVDYKFKREQTNRDRVCNYYSSILTQKKLLAEVKIFNSANLFLEKYKKTFLDNLKLKAKHVFNMSTYGLINTGIDNLFLLLCYMLIGMKLLSKESSIGDYTLFFSMIGQINFMLGKFKDMVSNYYEQMLEAKNYLEFEANKTDSIYIDNTTSDVFLNKIESIELKNLIFSYSNQNSLALNNVSLKLKKGEKVAIVGINGAGKSTLVKILLSLYKPNSGNILINGIDINKINKESFWEKTGAVFQDFNIYSISLAENILFKEYNEDKIWSVLDTVDIKTKVEKLPNGLKTMVSQSLYLDGIDFSGGEKQRIAIARALVKNADLLVFDEPASSLDAECEEKLYNIIQTTPNDKIVILISHRLASVTEMDRIIVIDNGHVIGDGSHSELIQNCHKYKEMFEIQANRYNVKNKNYIHFKEDL